MADANSILIALPVFLSGPSKKAVIRNELYRQNIILCS